MQDVLVGGAIALAAGAALVNGLKSDDPVTCESCQGTGGTRCFACGGEGKMGGVKLIKFENEKEQTDPVIKRDFFGRDQSNPRQCIACRGAGTILCRGCKGRGFN